MLLLAIMLCSCVDAAVTLSCRWYLGAKAVYFATVLNRQHTCPAWYIIPFVCVTVIVLLLLLLLLIYTMSALCTQALLTLPKSSTRLSHQMKLPW